MKTIMITPDLYDSVGTIAGNRDVNENHRDALLSTMSETGYIQHCPIKIVPALGGYRIVDGQHRFAAAKRLGLAVPAIVLDEGSEGQVVELNVNQRKWTLKDYLKYYAATSESYQNFERTCRQTGWTPTVARGEIGKAITYMRRKRPVCCRAFIPCDTPTFKKGALEYDLAQSDTVQDYYLLMTGALSHLPNYDKLVRQPPFWKALGRLCLHPEFEFPRFKRKLKELSGVVGMASNTQQYLDILVGIYNHKRSQQAHLKF